MAKNVQCCYCENLGIRFDEEHVPYDWCEKVTDSPDPLRERECEYYKKLVPPAAKPFGNGLDVCPVCGKPSTIGRPQTNADRIRQMTDEELAEFISSGFYIPHCPTLDSCPDTNNEGCRRCWLDWLKSPAEKDGEA